MDDQFRLNQALFASNLVFDQNRRSMRIVKKDNGEVEHQSVTVPHGAETLPDGGLRLTFYAPDAKTVTVSSFNRFRGCPHEMVKGDNGYWTLEVGPEVALPSHHLITFTVDGIKTINPRVPIGVGSHGAYNYAEVADEEQEFILLQDVPHGTVRRDLYKSCVSGGLTRACWVYTPPSYETNPDKVYPVWYLHHGGGENETAWIWQGKINLMLDNMIAAGECEEMIVVMNATEAFAPAVGDDCYVNIEYCAQTNDGPESPTVRFYREDDKKIYRYFIWEVRASQLDREVVRAYIQVPEGTIREQ